MKKAFLFLLVMIGAVSASAQGNFMIYRPAHTSTYSSPQVSTPDPFDEFMYETMRYNEAQAQAMQVVSSDIITASGLNLVDATKSQFKVNVVCRRNGLVELNCMGIKKKGTWTACNKELLSLENLFKTAKLDSEKEAILELMEYGNYLLIVDPDLEVYVIK